MNSILKLSLLLVLSGIWTGCRTDRKEITESIHIRLKKDPERLNPILFPNPVSREVYQYLFSPLADYNPETLELSPVLLKTMPVAEKIDTGKYAGGIRYRMELLDEAKWDDGSEITGHDYVFTVKAVKLPLTNASRYRENMQFIDEVMVDAANPKKFEVIFSQPKLLSLETSTIFELYPKYFYDPDKATDKISFEDLNKTDAESFAKDSIIAAFAENFNGTEFSRSKISGSGPYRFVQWESESFITLERKENYWGKETGRPNFQAGPKTIQFHIIPDDVNALAQLKEGNIDVMNEMTGADFVSLKNDPVYGSKFNFFDPALTKLYIININNRDVKLADKRVRKALARMIDVQSIIQNVEDGYGTPIAGPVHPSKKTYNKKLTPPGFDLKEARKLLSEAGWKDTDGNGILDKQIEGKKTDLSLDLYISGQELGKRIALMLQQNGKECGVQINIIEKEFKIIRSDHLKTRNYHLVPTVISMDLNAWDDLAGRWHSSNDTPQGANDLSYRNAEVDALIDKIDQTTDEKERLNLYYKIQELIYEDQPAIFLYAPAEKLVISKKWDARATVKRPGYMANTFGLSKVPVTSSN